MQAEHAGVSIDAGHHPERECGIAGSMPHWQVEHPRKPQISRSLLKNLSQAEPLRRRTFVVIAALKMSETDAGKLLEDSAQAPVRQHAINSVRRLSNIFEYENRAPQVRNETGAEKMSCHREVCHDQRTGCPTSSGSSALEIRNRLTEQHPAQTIPAPFRLIGQGGQQGTVHTARKPPGQSSPEQRGDIGETEEPAASPPDLLLQKPCGAPSSTCAGEKLSTGLRFKITSAIAVPTSQIAPEAIGA